MSEQVEFLSEHPALNKEFFEKILKDKYDTEAIVLKDFTFDAPNDKGYGIQITRAKLYYSFSGNENMDIVCSTFVIKTRRIDRDADDVLGKRNVFLKEAVFYLSILPDLYSIMGGKIVDTMLAPRCFAAQNESPFIVFEDLGKKGYEKTNNSIGLDFDHLTVCLTKLAKLHAASACYGCNGPPLLTVFKHPLLTSDTPEYLQFFTKPIQILAGVSATWPGFEKISGKLFKLETTMNEKVMNTFRATKFNVILHGDLWSNNLQYLYDKDAKPVDVIMLDYSSGYWASPSIDLAYLLFSSSSADVGNKELSELIDHYHQDLTHNLTNLNYSGYIPTMDDINEEIGSNAVPIIAVTTLANAFRLSDNSANMKMVSTVEEIDLLVGLMSTTSYRERMEFLLNYYDSMGFLD